MASRALLLARPGPFPFAGHLRLEARGDHAWIAIAASVASTAGPVGAFAPARALRAHLLTWLEPLAAETNDRNLLLRTLWDALADAPPAALGLGGGGDLSLLTLAGDRRGAGVAGVGLSGVWGMYVEAWEPLALGAHPLLGPTGCPKQLPGALRLTASPRRVLAAVASQPAVLPPLDEILARAGVRT
jgi:hypothetical protein